MDIAHSVSDYFKRLVVRFRIQKLPSSYPKPRFLHPATRRITLGLGLLLIALWLGIEADQGSQAQAIRLWERRHPPSARIWKFALAVYGFQELKDEKLFGRLRRSLPVILDATSQIWISSDAEWIAVSPDQIFCLTCKASKPKWEDLGSGWAGFEAAMEKLEKKPRSLKEKLRKKADPIDPREIRY